MVARPHIDAARVRLAGLVQHTPVEESRTISEQAGARTLLKCEHLQRTGSFKLRGAGNRIAALSEEERARGVVCASAGNHAQGVALSARGFGARATVFMPERAPLPKVAATRGYGADVRLVGSGFEEAYEASCAFLEETGGTYVHPFDHPEVIAGQGTLGLDIVEDVPDAGTVVVPIGGGGLAAGVASAVKLVSPGTRVVGVQAAGAASFPGSLAAGEPRGLDHVSTIADGIALKRPGDLTYAHVAERVDEIVTVSDESIARGVLLLAERAKQIVEPAGAAGVAALLDRSATLVEPVVAVLCGGNVDPILLHRILQSGLFEEGRYFAFRIRLRDRPGALSALLARIATTGANVLRVDHHRLNTRLGVLEVEVELEVETRGPGHIDELVNTLVEGGYPVN
ncbi:threonine ammonia-lyase [Egibacter rhizosphaerae]|uniref:L-threonine dehydratase catabolic TdcB n=1 Tax=Egibacter rhizosphaerae TaxID=1670831 RepID=A0A411YLP6_9ACTN|nr:threonine ammonia-lyase [Egibacter rhizosphaerae]